MATLFNKNEDKTATITGDGIVQFKTVFELFVDTVVRRSHCSQTKAEAAAMTDHVRCRITQLRQQIVDHLTTVVCMDQT